MGLPAAGKSTWIAANLSTTHFVIDPDAIKEAHPDYDPKNPRPLHAWSARIAASHFATALLTDDSWVVDGTATNADKVTKNMAAAKAAGFAVRLVFSRISCCR